MFKSYFESTYFHGHRKVPVKKLIVSFPGRKGNRLYGTEPNEITPALYKTLCSCDADVAFMRAVYEARDEKSSFYANITDDYHLLPGYIHDLRKRENIDQVILFGYSLGCGPCLWLARQGVADEAVILSPSQPALEYLQLVDDPRWGNNFRAFCEGRSVDLQSFPSNLVMRIYYGNKCRQENSRDDELSNFIKSLSLDSVVKPILGSGHEVLLHWMEHDVLRNKVYEILKVEHDDTTGVNNLSFSWKQISSANSLPLRQAALKL